MTGRPYWCGQFASAAGGGKDWRTSGWAQGSTKIIRTVAALLALQVIALCEALGWWRIPFASTPYFVTVLYAGLAISLTPIYLVTWRLARRFGWRGLAVFVGVVAIIGPPRDCLYAATFPKWMVFSPGIAPILADSAAYVLIVVVGHAVMRLVAGPARADHLARGTG
ncbi:MAG: hypothetical protein ACMG6H_00800 [Acidobacteriota bacterium]